jgi:hypothetical protein
MYAYLQTSKTKSTRKFILTMKKLAAAAAGAIALQQTPPLR